MKLTKDYQLIAEKWLGYVYNSKSAYIRLYAKYNSQSIENNTTNVSIQARLYSEENWWASSGTYYRITGSESIDSDNINVLTYETSKWAIGEVVLGTQTKNISHDSDGSRTIHAEVNFVSLPWYWDVTATATDIELPKIARYATFTEHYIKSVTQNSIQVKWGADVNTDEIQYSLNGGDWINTSGNPYMISGLSSGTEYSIKTKIRRTDSQLYTTSEALKATTKDYVLKTKINGVWKDAIPYIKINGVWKKAIPYIKINGNWKPGVD